MREVVQAGHTAAKADQWISQDAASEIPEEGWAKFIETVEVELLSLHEGNIARYRLRPGEFAQW
ncbi:MAG: hypothetical protein O3C21_19040 [Verrucomicrobia bacterium]|nr:hypothetical protein [Verrucomicrobiota bacterium]